MKQSEAPRVASTWCWVEAEGALLGVKARGSSPFAGSLCALRSQLTWSFPKNQPQASRQFSWSTLPSWLLRPPGCWESLGAFRQPCPARPITCQSTLRLVSQYSDEAPLRIDVLSSPDFQGHFRKATSLYMQTPPVGCHV